MYEFLFNEISSIENKNFSQYLETFYKLGIKGPTKENIQNSLDARLYRDEPVKVVIKTGEINVLDLPGYSEIKKRILLLSGANQYTNETIQHMQRCVMKNIVKYISFEDMNTKGLTYIKNNEDCSYYAYAYQQGNHFSDNNISEAMRGGSHGIGKIASNAISDIHLMYFANCDSDGQQLIGGTINLIEHTYKNRNYRGMGYFTKSMKEPYVNNINNEVFQKKTRGLKIIIPFLKDDFDEKEIVQCICAEYFVAILNGDLEVKINNMIINKNTIEKYILNEKFFSQDYDKMRKEYTVLYYKTYTQEDPFNIKIDEYEFQCYFKYDENIKKGRIAFIRRMGMKIADQKIRNYANSSFNAIIIPQNDKSDNFLKSLENQSHNEISYESIRDENIKSKTRSIMKKLENEIRNVFKEKYEYFYPSEGIIDTQDLLYTFETSFKDVVNKNTATVLINRDTGSKKITKINFGRESKTTSSTKKSKVINKTIKKATRSGLGKNVQSTRYIIYPENIYRIGYTEKEYFECDLSANKELKNYKRCSIILKVVDGEGKEVKQIMNLKYNFKSIVDENKKKELDITGNIIRNVSIINDRIKLTFYPNDNHNSSLKYIYFVEV